MRQLPRTLLALAVLAAAAGLGGAVGSAGTGRPLRIGLVLDNTNVNDPFQHGAFVGLQRAVRKLGVVGKVVAPSPRETFASSFSYLARQRYDLIIAIGFFEVQDLDAAARAFPQSKFAIIDASIDDLKHRPGNVRGGTFRTEQAGYLAGYLAALMEERRPGKDVIGSVGGVKIPTVDSYIAGYRAGARSADPRITLLNAYSGDFLNRSKCRAIALQQIAAGAGAVFQVADACGLGALAAAKEKHVWGIGVDVDQSFLGSYVLTSVVKRFDVEIYDTVRALVDGRLETGANAVWDVRNGAVGLGRISPPVPPSLASRLDAIRARIAAGTIEVPSTL